MSDFLGLRIGLSALQSHKRALDVAGQNLANVNTVGYSRQTTNLSSVDAKITSAIHSTWSQTGQGVEVVDVSRMQDRFLEARSLVEHSTQALMCVLSTTQAAPASRARACASNCSCSSAAILPLKTPATIW